MGKKQRERKKRKTCEHCGCEELTGKEIDQVGWLLMMHFPKMSGATAGMDPDSDVADERFCSMIESLSCFDCEDSRMAVCRGRGLVGWEVMGCMEEKMRAGSTIEGGESWGFIGKPRN